MLTRRRLLCLLPAALARAGDAAVRELFARMAEALSTGSPAGFLRPFDRQMPGYPRLEASIFALLNQFEVASSVELVEEQGDGQRRALELDWMLEIRSQAPAGSMERRRETVKATLERRGKSWRITALEPVEFFAPPRGR
jgi:hypothetical protein